MKDDLSRKIIRKFNRLAAEKTPSMIARKLFGANFTREGNFHCVGEDGQYFRSGQLDADQLEAAIRNFGIRTVVNLRRVKPEKHSYREEIEVCDNEGVEYLECRLRLEEPGVGLRRLINILDEKRYPVLAHCTGGRDRAGIAAAVYRMVIKNESAIGAMEELNGRYDHHFSEYDGLLWHYFTDWKKSGERLNFREWIKTYNECLKIEGQECETVEN
jgi:protein tyrosine/serine phosphatase